MKYIITIFIIIIIRSTYLFGQSDDFAFSSERNIESTALNIEEQLINNGFENIKIIPSDSSIIIAYENRIYRFEIEALAKVILLLPKTSLFDFVLVPHHQTIPMLSVEIKGENLGKLDSSKIDHDFVNNLMISLDTDQWNYELSKGQFKSPTTFKFDVAIGPVISATQFGNYNRHIRTIVDIAPSLHLQIRKGLTLNAQALYPLFNNFNEDKLRLGLLNITQHVRLKSNAFASLSVGNFTRRRMGYLIDYNKYLFNGQFSVGATLGGTTWSRHSGELLSDFFEKGNFLYARANVLHRWAKYDLITKVSYGTFMIQDKGWRIDIQRQFGQSRVGIFGTLTELLKNAGFTVSLALPTKKYSSFKKPIRVRTTEYLQYEYKFTGQTLRGLNIKTGSEIQEEIIEFHPDFIKNQLTFLLNQ